MYIHFQECMENKNKGWTMNKEYKMNKDYVGNYGLVEVEYTDCVLLSVNNDIDISKRYTFKIDLKSYKKVKIDSLVVVDGINGLKVARVKEITPLDISKGSMEASKRAKAWVVNILDAKAHIERIAKTERKQFIMKELQLLEELENM